MTWWWPCDMESKDGIPLVCLYIYIYIYIYIYMLCIYVCLIISSPYLLVFGDDRVCGTREQMMFLVNLMRPRAGAKLVWEKVLLEFLCFMVLK